MKNKAVLFLVILISLSFFSCGVCRDRLCFNNCDTDGICKTEELELKIKELDEIIIKKDKNIEYYNTILQEIAHRLNGVDLKIYQLKGIIKQKDKRINQLEEEIKTLIELYNTK